MDGWIREEGGDYEYDHDMMLMMMVVMMVMVMTLMMIMMMMVVVVMMMMMTIMAFMRCNDSDETMMVPVTTWPSRLHVHASPWA